MPVYTDKRNGRLFVQFDYKKQTFKQTLPPGATRKDAHKLETKMRSDVFFQAMGMAPRDEVVFDDFVQETYLPHVQANLSPAGYIKAEYVLIAAKPFLKGKLLRSIKPADIEKFKIYRMQTDSMHGRPRKPATVWRELSVLSKMFTLAIREGLCDTNPVTKIERPKFDNVQNKVLPREDEADFLAAFDADQGQTAKDICILVLNTGLRQNDVLGLNDFQLTPDSIRLVQGKTARIAEIPLNATAAEIVARYSGKGLLFPSPKFKKPQPMHYIRKAIAGACRRVNEQREKAGLPPMPIISIRDLRRTFATRLAEDGADALTIAMLLGHADLRMVHRYARSLETMRKAVEKLDKPTPSLPKQNLRIVK